MRLLERRGQRGGWERGQPRRLSAAAGLLGLAAGVAALTPTVADERSAGHTSAPLLERLRALSQGPNAPRVEDVEGALAVTLIPAAGGDQETENEVNVFYRFGSLQSLGLGPDSYARRVLPHGLPFHFLGGGAARLAPYVDWLIVLKFASERSACISPTSLVATWGAASEVRGGALNYSGPLGSASFTFSHGCLRTAMLHLAGEEGAPRPTASRAEKNTGRS